MMICLQIQECQLNQQVHLKEKKFSALDGWSASDSISIYNFIILTPQKTQYLYCLCDYSNSHHTGQFLAAEIKTIINKIGVKKFKAIVSDNGANVKLAREIIVK